MIEMKPRIEDPLLSLKEILNEREEKFLSQFATPSTECIRAREEEHREHEHRLPFAIDADRILHSRAFTRYIQRLS